MEQNQLGQLVGGNSGIPTEAYGMNQYPSNNMMALSHPSTQTISLLASSFYPRDQQYAHQYICQEQNELQQQLDNFWANQYQEIEQTTNFRNHSFSLARIKKIMKAHEEVNMVSAEASVIFAKACEMFIMDLTMRAWISAEENKRRILQNNDIAATITRTNVFSFLVDAIPSQVVKEYFKIHTNNMDQNQLGQLVGGNNGTPAQAYGMNQYQSNNMMILSHPPTQPISLPTSFSYPREQHAHYYIRQQQHGLLQQLNNFWANQSLEIEHTTNFRNHSLSLSRIKKIMKADKEVKMVSPEAPDILAKACKMFIMELTMRAWVNAEEDKRKTLQKNDIVAAITGTNVFDFLVDGVSVGYQMDYEVYGGIPRDGRAPIENIPYHYMPAQHVAVSPYGPPRVVIETPVDDQARYGQ